MDKNNKLIIGGAILVGGLILASKAFGSNGGGGNPPPNPTSLPAVFNGDLAVSKLNFDWSTGTMIMDFNYKATDGLLSVIFDVTTGNANAVTGLEPNEYLNFWVAGFATPVTADWHAISPIFQIRFQKVDIRLVNGVEQTLITDIGKIPGSLVTVVGQPLGM